MICKKEFIPKYNNQKCCSYLCSKQTQKEYREFNKEKLIKYNKEYCQTHKKESHEYKKIYNKNHKIKNLEYQRKYYLEHKVELKEKYKKYRKLYSKKYYNLYKEEISKRKKKYYDLHKEQFRELSKKYYQEHKEYIKKRNKIYHTRYCNNRRKNDVNFKVLCYLRTRMCEVLKGNYKSNTTLKLLGCSLEILKHHLESNFKSGMNWQNYGTWHIDHIKSCCNFSLSNPKEQKKCFNYRNLRPLWAVENLSRTKK